MKKKIHVHAIAFLMQYAFLIAWVELARPPSLIASTTTEMLSYLIMSFGWVSIFEVS